MFRSVRFVPCDFFNFGIKVLLWIFSAICLTLGRKFTCKVKFSFGQLSTMFSIFKGKILKSALYLREFRERFCKLSYISSQRLENRGKGNLCAVSAIFIVGTKIAVLG